MNILKAEPAAVTAAVTAIVGVLITTGVIDEVLGGSIVVMISAIMVVVRQSVTSNQNVALTHADVAAIEDIKETS